MNHGFASMLAGHPVEAQFAPYPLHAPDIRLAD
jgi:hypothetical protein